jgi:hypothetical protein
MADLRAACQDNELSLAHVPIELTHNLSIVVPGLVPGIHVAAPQTKRGWPGHKGVCARLRGLSPAMTSDFTSPGYALVLWFLHLIHFVVACEGRRLSRV